jgi:mannose-6-phosphate isomerase-like protein (cupin superfamily)
MDRRNALLGLFAAMAASTGQAGAKDGSGSTGAWTDRLYTLKNSKTTPAPFGETTVYFEGKTDELPYMEAGSVLLHPGQEPHPPHQHPEEEFVIIGEGHGHILVGGENTAVGPGTLMYSESNKLHGIKNTGTQPLRFYFCKWKTA